ncbi:MULTISPECIES: hypothetical protein [unclassified Mesorhizobium]|uniref:hypothetical protein n=1 Tax=unclassified Mesorhizobium TaxID=325217 RepID=UPI000F751FB7|nr:MULTISPECIES: hypothetical protein [unclassified Mesorhizobium]AZO54600.1 hypothetical protein EJ077_14860 [Mesorhizobium sp. M8A.F.Ca.ET.057.01.1.1]RWE50054.1 MAG: hypothetical protein EOS80_03235 [Mesorhizobium sp.]
MTQFTSLIREIIPAWLLRRSLPNAHEGEPSLDPSRPPDADEVWLQFVQKDLFDANTQDYAEAEDKKTDRH